MYGGVLLDWFIEQVDEFEPIVKSHTETVCISIWKISQMPRYIYIKLKFPAEDCYTQFKYNCVVLWRSSIIRIVFGGYTPIREDGVRGEPRFALSEVVAPGTLKI